MTLALDPAALAALFTEARSHNGWTDEPVSDEQLHQVYELAGRHNLDALIVLSSTLSHEVGLDGVRSFCDQFSGLPLCSLGVALPHKMNRRMVPVKKAPHPVKHAA